jgi:multidrug efflux pump subunit AcrA (membrane-fusion protein)
MSSQLTQRDSLDTESELLPQEPPSWVIRWTAWLLIAAFLVALLIAIVMRLPETVDCRFVLIPATGADLIQSPRQAIINRVVVEEGQPVKAGEVLFVLRSDEIGDWNKQFRTLTEDLRTKQESLSRNESAYAAQVGQAGLPKLAVAQRVRYFFEAFPYQRYGTITGNVDWISPSAVTTTEGSRFVALGSLDRYEIASRAGQALPLRVGMKGDAHIIVGGRTLIEYAFEPIRQLRESIKQ